MILRWVTWTGTVTLIMISWLVWLRDVLMKSYECRSSNSRRRIAYILHELLADRSNVLAESGAEHHHLLLIRSGAEDLLNISSHVQLLQHLVTLVQNKVFQILQTQLLTLDQGEDAARSSNNNVRTVVLQHLLVLGDGHASEENSNLDGGHELADLEGELPGVAHDQHRDLTNQRLVLLCVNQSE